MIILRRAQIPYEGRVVPALIPTDQHSWESISGMRLGQDVRVEARRARSAEQHRMFFAVLNRVWEATGGPETFKTADDLREATLVELGYTERRRRWNGEHYLVAKSMSFHSMKQNDFNRLFNDAITLWSSELGIEPETLLSESRVRFDHQKSATVAEPAGGNARPRSSAPGGAADMPVLWPAQVTPQPIRGEPLSFTDFMDALTKSPNREHLESLFGQHAGVFPAWPRQAQMKARDAYYRNMERLTDSQEIHRHRNDPHEGHNDL